MKKVMFMMIAAIIFGCGVFAQDDDYEEYEDYDEVKQSRFLIGGNVACNFAQTKTTDTYDDDHEFIDELNFHFKPYFGYLINNKLTIGVKLGLNYYENAFADPHTIPVLGDYDNATLGITDGNSFEIAPFLRFQDTLVGKFRYYIDFCMGAEFSGDMKAVIHRDDDYDYKYDYKLNYYYANADVGLLFLLSQRTGIEFKLAGVELGKRYEKLDDDYELESTNFDFFSDFLQPNLGIVVNF
jgi:hypothetical protein